MKCGHCGQENRADSKFCRSCGVKLSSGDAVENNLGALLSNLKESPHLQKALRFVRKNNARTVVVAVVVLFLGVGSVFAAPKVDDYLEVNKLLSEAAQLESEGAFGEALAALTAAEEKWTLKSKQQKLEEEKQQQEQFLDFKKYFEAALEKQEAGELKSARDLLQSIDTSYPEYELVKEKLAEIQTEIEDDLEARAAAKEREAERQAAAADAARRRAEAQEAAKVRAQAEKEASEAQARAAAREAQEAEARAAAEAFEAFVDETVTIYNSVINGINHIIDAGDYVGAGQYVSAAAVNLQAQSVFSDAEERSQNLLRYRTPDGYRAVGENLKCAASDYSTAAYYMNKAIADIRDYTSTTFDYNLSQARDHMSSGKRCLNLVSSWLTQQGR